MKVKLVELSDEKTHIVIPKDFSHKGRHYQKTYCGQSYCIATISKKEVSCSICSERCPYQPDRVDDCMDKDCSSYNTCHRR